MHTPKLVSIALRILAAGILLQTLYFKFSGAEESVELFTKLGVEPWGRIGTGVVELVAGILLLVPSTIVYGALLGVGLMAGALLSHLIVIGVESKGDGGLLFGLACVVLVCCLCLLWMHKDKVTSLVQQVTGKKNV